MNEGVAPDTRPTGLPRVIDVKVECGKVYRYRNFQRISREGKTANEIRVGEILPDLGLPDVEPPCKCPVIDVVGRF